MRYITDDLFTETVPNPVLGGFQTVLSLATAPEYRGKGIAGKLVQQLIKVCQGAKREAITLTCLENLIPFYKSHGFKNEGVSASERAGETWYNLVYEIR